MTRLLLLFHLATFVLAENWMDNSPGLAMDYRVHIDAGKEDCYYQYVHPGATIYASMNVLKGGDMMAGFAVRNPQGIFVKQYEWKHDSDYEEVANTGGHYAICIDNQFSKMSAKLVNLYITTFRHDLWEKFSAELEEMNLHVANFTESLSSVDQRITFMLQHQAQSRALEARDYQLLIQNNSYVQYWSGAQCMALIAASVAQVYLIKKILNSGDPSNSRSKTGLRA